MKDNAEHLEHFQGFSSFSCVALNLLGSYVGLDVMLRSQIKQIHVIKQWKQSGLLIHPAPGACVQPCGPLQPGVLGTEWGSTVIPH